MAALLAGAAIAVSPPAKAETVTVGMVGAVSSTHWPVYIGLTKGYFAAEDLKLDLCSSSRARRWPSSSPPARSTVAMSTGLADPIRAIDKGAPIAIVRIEMQAPPYALLAKPAIKSWSDLKGKTISIGGPKDITRIYLERMAGPNGVKPGDYDMVFAGATSARFSALQAGAVDAAILLPPFNFYAESAGFTNLGLTIDYAKDLPFAGAVVGRSWANVAQDAAREGAVGPQQEHCLVLRSAEPRRGDQDHGATPASSRRKTSPSPMTSCTRMSSSRPPARSPGAR